MTRIPFIVTHAGCSALCALFVNSSAKVQLLEFIGLRDNQAAPLSDRESFAAKVADHISFLNDLMAADMPFEALATCRRSPGLFGAILDPAVTEIENVRAGLNAGGSDAA